jgi:hypothetical protein
VALTQSITFNGLSVPNAYIRIDRIFGGKREGWNSVVSVYASQEAAATREPLKQFNVPAEYSAIEENPYVLLYRAIKGLDEYAEATDC